TNKYHHDGAGKRFFHRRSGLCKHLLDHFLTFNKGLHIPVNRPLSCLQKKESNKPANNGSFIHVEKQTGDSSEYLVGSSSSFPLRQITGSHITRIFKYKSHYHHQEAEYESVNQRTPVVFCKRVR